MVEDEPAVVELVREAIGTRPLQVHSALTITAAFTHLDRCGSDPWLPMPSLVLLDINLPIFTGMVLLKERNRGAKWPDVPIVVLTSSELERAQCLSLGAREYLLKPAAWADWQLLVDALIAKYLP